MHTWQTDADATPGAWLREVVESLEAGGAVALPTDTFYGLAADSRSSAGIDRVLRLKGRPSTHPLLLLVHSCAAARRVSPAADARLEELAAAFWPGPLTVILPATEGFHEALLGPTGGIAVRVPDAAAPRRVAQTLGAPITGTSANVTGGQPPRAADVIDLDVHLLSGIVDGGTCPGGLASTIVDLTTTVARVVRAGAIPAEIVRKSLNGGLV